MENEEKIIITGSQHDRTWNLDFDFIPKNDSEFLEFVRDCPTEMLKGFGFSKWDTYNAVIEENAAKPVSNKISFPAFNIDGSQSEDFVFDSGRGNAPIKPLTEDRDIWLLPAEWYNSVPENYTLIDISAKSHIFKRGVTDDRLIFNLSAISLISNPLPFNRFLSDSPFFSICNMLITLFSIIFCKCKIIYYICSSIVYQR
jgi:hypothetical protein